MTVDIEAQIDRAMAKGEMLANRVPRARSVRYEPTSQTIAIELSNGCRFTFPVKLIEGLAGQSANDIAAVTVTGIGFGISWDRLDIDLSVPDLMAGLFGTSVWMNSQRAAIAGAARSEAKSEAARRNGAKGGRPRKAV